MAFSPIRVDGFDNYTVGAQRWTAAGGFTCDSIYSRHSWGQGALLIGDAIELPPTNPFIWEGAMRLNTASFPPFGRPPDVVVAKHSNPVATQSFIAIGFSDTFHPFISRVQTGAILAGPTTGPEYIIVPSVWYWWALKVYLHDTNGYVQFHVNGEPWLEAFNVNTTNTAALEQVVDYFQIGGQTGHQWQGDDFVWQDGSTGEFQGDMLVIGKRPTAAGAFTEFSLVGAATNHEAVDEVAADEDTSYVHSDVLGERDCYIIQDITEVPDTSIVLAVQQAFRHEKTEPGPRSVTGFIRVATDEVFGEERFPSENQYRTSIEAPITVQPDGTSAWGTVGDFNALDVEIGHEVGDGEGS